MRGQLEGHLTREPRARIAIEVAVEVVVAVTVVEEVEQQATEIAAEVAMQEMVRVARATTAEVVATRARAVAPWPASRAKQGTESTLPNQK